MQTIKSFIPVLFICCYALSAYSQNVETIQIRPGPDNGVDCEIRTDMNYPIWNDDDFISNAWTAGGNSFLQRSLIKFDLSSIPISSVIVSAELSLYCNTSSGHQQLHSGYNSSYLLMITSVWDQQLVVWNNQPETTFENAVLLPQSEYQTQDYPNIDLTSQIDYFYKNPDHNFGFMMQLAEEEEYAAMVFASSNHLNPEKRPLLVINYIPCENPDPNFSYSLVQNSTTVNFTLSPNDNTNYWWDFGNGYYSDLPQPVFTYQQTGKYNVCLTASNDCDTIVKCDTVIVCNLPNAQFSYEIQGNMGFFSPSELVDEDQYLWDFGDGFLSYLAEPAHYYNSPGYFLVCLTVTNSCSSVQYCDSVMIVISGIENLVENEIRIFPNPSDGGFFIEKENNNLNIIKLKVFAIDGTLVSEFNSLSGLNNSGGFKCDLSSFANGVYTMFFETDSGFVNRKVVLLRSNQVQTK